MDLKITTMLSATIKEHDKFYRNAMLTASTTQALRDVQLFLKIRTNSSQRVPFYLLWSNMYVLRLHTLKKNMTGILAFAKNVQHPGSATIETVNPMSQPHTT